MFSSQGKINLSRSNLSRQGFWTTLRKYYKENLFTDLHIVCASGSLKCHRLILCSLSKMLRDALLISNLDEVSVVMLPEQDLGEVEGFVDSVYDFLASKQVQDSPECIFSTSMKEIFQIQFQTEAKKGMEVSMLLPNIEPHIKLEEPEAFFGGKDFDQDFTFDLDNYNLDNKDLTEKKQKRTKLKRNVKQSPNDDVDDDGCPKKKRVKGPEVKRRFHDVVEVSDIEDRKEIFKVLSRAADTLRVRVLPEVYDVNKHLLSNATHSHKPKPYFMAIVGIVFKNTSSYKVKPLAWSFPSDQDLVAQFDNVHHAFQVVFGLAKGDICYSPLMYSRQGMYRQNKSKKVKSDLIRRYASLSNEQLTEMLNKPEIEQVLRRCPSKPPMNLSEGSYDFQLDSGVPFNQLEGIAVFHWSKSLEIQARMIFMADQEREEKSKDLMTTVFEVWSLDRKVGRQKLIPECAYFCKLFDDLILPMETYSVIKDFQADVDRKKRDAIVNKEKQCPDCGLVFPLVTLQQERLFHKHEQKHFFEKFECNCVNKGNTATEKVSHVKLVHMKEEYEQCQKCHHIGHKLKMKSHECDFVEGQTSNSQDPSQSKISKLSDMEGYSCCDQNFLTFGDITNHVTAYHSAEHFVRCAQCNYLGVISGVAMHKKIAHNDVPVKRNFICELCGKDFTSNLNLYSHRIQKHRSYECKLCQLQFLGYRQFSWHKKKVHEDGGKKVTCEVCGTEFANMTKLKHHVVRMHMEEKDRPIKCDQCGRGFAINFELREHQMKAHIKARPLRCRYGCGAAYNDYDSRLSHEKKKHGGVYSKRHLINKHD